MAHVLRVATRQIRDPVLVFVLVKADNCRGFCLRHPFRVVQAGPTRTIGMQGIMEKLSALANSQ
jgi:hypothetical protein